MKKLARRLGKLRFYLSNGLRHAWPDGLYRRALPRLLREAEQRMGEYQARLDYCCKLHEPFMPGDDATRIDAVSTRRRAYFYDFRDVARYFDPSLRAEARFGDVTEVLPRPTFTKSRPIGDDNGSNVLLRLNQVRHFQLVERDKPYAAKRDMAVWRGRCGEHPARQRIVRDWHAHPLCDVGDVADRAAGEPWHRSFMSVREQLDFKFIVSLEGIDVASNTKWIMSSNSLCLMPRPRFETWFMEGALVPGEHYVLLKDDCSDLADKIDYYRAHSDEAEAIVANARAWVAPFRDRHSELLLQLLVMRKYFTLSGQL